MQRTAGHCKISASGIITDIKAFDRRSDIQGARLDNDVISDNHSESIHRYGTAISIYGKIIAVQSTVITRICGINIQLTIAGDLQVDKIVIINTNTRTVCILNNIISL